jgi:hypothetical protein
MEPLLCIGSWTRPNLYGGNLIGGIFVCFGLEPLEKVSIHSAYVLLMHHSIISSSLIISLIDLSEADFIRVHVLCNYRSVCPLM